MINIYTNLLSKKLQLENATPSLQFYSAYNYAATANRVSIFWKKT